MSVSIPECTFTPVDPVRPLAPYIGGKRQLAKRLVGLINSIEHNTYAEVFVGMGGVFLRRNQRPKAEIINDWAEDVATFFRVVQHHYVASSTCCAFRLRAAPGSRSCWRRSQRR